jgi:hypothetical protein
MANSAYISHIPRLPATPRIEKSSREDLESCIVLHFRTSSIKQASDGMTHQRPTSQLTKDGQGSSSIGSTLIG